MVYYNNSSKEILYIRKILDELSYRETTNEPCFPEFHGIGWVKLCDKAIETLNKMREIQK